MASTPAQEPRHAVRRTGAIIAAAALLGALAGALLLPPGGLPGDHAGDARLAQLAREEFDEPGVHALAIAVVQPDPARGASRVRTTTIGAPLDARWEIGSISKAVTGLLYADALERGEIDPGTTLGDALDLGDVPAAAVTLEALSRHRSGLPRLPSGAGQLWQAIDGIALAGNPYPDDLADLTAQLRRTEPGEREPQYSNFGFEALGAALAASAGQPYPELVRDRIARPLSLGLLAALLAGRAPGLDALEPVVRFREGDGDEARVRIGAAWFTTEEDGRTLTFHNGGTGGFRAWAGIDRASGVGLAVVAATSSPDVWDESQELLAELASGERRP